MHNLHAVPGALGGLASVVVALAIPASAYGGDIGAMVSYDRFFVRAYLESISTIRVESMIHTVSILAVQYEGVEKYGRSMGTQAAFQLAAVICTVCT